MLPKNDTGALRADLTGLILFSVNTELLVRIPGWQKWF